MCQKPYYEKIIDEILELFKNNLILLYNFNDETLENIRSYCNLNSKKKYKPLSYANLIYFAEEALTELINCDCLYDIRDID